MCAFMHALYARINVRMLLTVFLAEGHLKVVSFITLLISEAKLD